MPEAVGFSAWLAGAGLRRLAAVHLCLVKACHRGVAFDDGFELGMARNLIEVRKPVGSPLLHDVNDTLWPARAVILDDLGRRRQARSFICLERRHDIRCRGQERRHAACI